MRFIPLLLLLLSACSPKALSQVRAQVRNWPGSAGRVAFLAADRTTLSGSTIDAVGRFTLPLPSAAVLAPLLTDHLPADAPSTCRSTVRASDPAARFYLLDHISAFPAGDQGSLSLVSLTRSDAPGNPQRVDQRLFIYATLPTLVQGELRCHNGRVTTSYALNLKAGWNHTVNHQSLDSSGERSSRLESVGDEGFEGWAVAR